MRTRHVLASVSALVLAGGTLVATAAPASADQIWYQGVSRATADAACPASAAADMAAGWSEWVPSWAQWPNSGKGGYVCTRSITWAYEDTGGTAMNCIQASAFIFPLWMNFGSGSSLPAGSPIYLDAGCSQFFQNSSVPVVTASSQEEADDLCDAFGSYYEARNNILTTVYDCEPGDV